MKFSLILSSFNYGGIEILFLKLAKILSKESQVDVYILSKKVDKNLYEELGQYANIFTVKDFLSFNLPFDSVGINALIPWKPSFIKKIEKTENIHLADTNCLICWLNILNKKLSIKNISLGAYHSEELVWQSKWYFREVEKDAIRAFGSKNILVTNNASKLKLIKEYGKSMNSVRMMPAGVEINDSFQKRKYKNLKNKLVCISRLVNYKEYILRVADSIDSVIKKFPDFEFHIYGDGPERKRFQEYTKGKKIFFHKGIEISEFKNAVQDAKIFIGSGTSLIYASALSVPSIIGIESAKTTETYGFFCETKGLDYQEQNQSYELKNISDVILEALSMSEDDFQEVALKCYDRSKDFCITKTIEAIKSSQNMNFENQLKLGFLKKAKYIYSFFTWSLLNKLGIIQSKKDRHHLK